MVAHQPEAEHLEDPPGVTMPPLLRSRQPPQAVLPTTSASAPAGERMDEEANKGNTKSFYERNRAQLVILLSVLVCSIIALGAKTNKIIVATRADAHLATTRKSGKSDRSDAPKLSIQAAPQRAPMGSIIYGAKSKGDDTARLVKEAIQAGFRHIATGGFHFEYNEAGVGAGWKDSGVPRNELFLQTLFLAQSVNGYATQNCNLEDGTSCPPPSDLSIEDQVHLSIKSSLNNLQTDYIDAVLVHNFRAKLQPYDETLRAWRVLEGYVEKSIIRHLGIVSVHDKEYLTKLHDDATVKPSIIQNRFHSNRGYDISLRPVFKDLGLANQLFWILTGSAGGKVRNNGVVKELAKKMGVSSPQILLYSFTMELGGSPLIGSKSAGHMREDVDALVKRKIKWERDDLVAMAAVLNKDLVK